MKLSKKLASMFLSVTLMTSVVAAPVQAATSTNYNYVMSLVTKIQSGQKTTTPTKPSTPSTTPTTPSTPSTTPTTPSTPSTTPSTPSTTTPSTSYTPSQFEQRVVELVNVERQKAGLKPLVADSLLMKGAHAKSLDMVTKNYFSHTSPTYGSPFAMMKTFGVKYSAAGENIASGQKTPEAVVKAWMNSAGHRANILSTKYGKIGVGYAYKSSGNYHHYWTQWFTN